MKSQSELQLAFLEDTIKHYNSTNRGVVIYCGCSYTAGCAIGRHLSKELCEKLDDCESNGVSNTLVFNQLPADLQALGQEFLTLIQKLHDSSEYWDEKGLSSKGLEKANNIKDYFKLV